MKKTNKKTPTTRKSTSSQQPKGKSNGKSNGKSHSPESDNSALMKFFVDGIKDMYWAEKQLLKALPKMAKAATSDELVEAFENHLDQTEDHVARLEEVFGLLGEKVQAKKCDAMEGLIKEGNSTIEDTEDGSMTRDAALIVAAQKVEHYEIASYGSLAQLAKGMGKAEVKEILGQILQQEKETDELLTQLAEKRINVEAEMEEVED